METKILVVCMKEGQPKGILTQKQYTTFTERQWWDSTKVIEVPLEDWNNDKVRIDTIQRYL